MKPYPTYPQREVLQLLMTGDWMPLLKLIAAGDRLLGNLVQAGWIERSPDVKTGGLYRITEADEPPIRHLSRSKVERHGRAQEIH